MSTIVSEHDISRLAALARLQFDSVERQRLTGELESILDYVRQLQKVDISGVKAFSDHYAHKALLRPDQSRVWTTDNLLANVPTEQGLLVVKNVFDRHES